MLHTSCFVKRCACFLVCGKKSLMNSARRPVVEVIANCVSKASKRQLHISAAKMAPIKVGDKIPSVDLFEDSPANKVNIADLCGGKKVVIFAVPGAFTPGCSKTHLPGYIKDADKLKKEGIAEILCISVNDPYVMAAWGKAQNTTGKIRMLSDPLGNFTKAIDLSTDLPPLGGLRSKRYSMILENCVVTTLNVEPDGTGLSCSLADKLKV